MNPCRALLIFIVISFAVQLACGFPVDDKGVPCPDSAKGERYSFKKNCAYERGRCVAIKPRGARAIRKNKVVDRSKPKSTSSTKKNQNAAPAQVSTRTITTVLTAAAAITMASPSFSINSFTDTLRNSVATGSPLDTSTNVSGPAGTSRMEPQSISPIKNQQSSTVENFSTSLYPTKPETPNLDTILTSTTATTSGSDYTVNGLLPGKTTAVIVSEASSSSSSVTSLADSTDIPTSPSTNELTTTEQTFTDARSSTAIISIVSTSILPSVETSYTDFYSATSENKPTSDAHSGSETAETYPTSLSDKVTPPKIDTSAFTTATSPSTDELTNAATATTSMGNGVTTSESGGLNENSSSSSRDTVLSSTPTPSETITSLCEKDVSPTNLGLILSTSDSQDGSDVPSRTDIPSDEQIPPLISTSVATTADDHNGQAVPTRTDLPSDQQIPPLVPESSSTSEDNTPSTDTPSGQQTNMSAAQVVPLIPLSPATSFGLEESDVPSRTDQLSDQQVPSIATTTRDDHFGEDVPTRTDLPSDQPVPPLTPPPSISTAFQSSQVESLSTDLPSDQQSHSPVEISASTTSTRDDHNGQDVLTSTDLSNDQLFAPLMPVPTSYTDFPSDQPTTSLFPASIGTSDIPSSADDSPATTTGSTSTQQQPEFATSGEDSMVTDAPSPTSIQQSSPGPAITDSTKDDHLGVDVPTRTDLPSIYVLPPW